MRPFLLIAAVVLATLTLPAAAQVTENWAKAVTVTSPYTSCITTDASGNVYVAGTNTGSFSYVLIKYNPSGVQQWVANGVAGTSIQSVTLGYPGVAGIGIDGSGNVYITCNAVGGMTTTAYNSSGQQLWQTLISYSNAYCIAFATAVDPSGNVYITGKAEADGGGTGAYSCLTVKLNSSGSQQWAVAYNSTTNAALGSYIALDASGNVYIAGTTTNTHIYLEKALRGISLIRQDTSVDILAIKYGPSGNMLWANVYNGGYATNDAPNGLALDASGNAYLIGYSKAASQVNELIAWSASGSQLWLNQAIPAVSYNSSIAVDPAGNIVTQGLTGSTFNVTKYTSSGTVTWTYYGSAISSGNSYMALDKQGNCYVTGTAAGNYVTVEVTAAGTPGWQVAYNGPANGSDAAAGIATFTPNPIRPGIVSYPEINVTGTADNETDITTVQYTIDPVIKLASSTPDSLTSAATTLAKPAAPQLANYPNPFRGATTIAYTLPQNSHVILQVYDGAGRPVATLVDQYQSAGTYTLPFGTAGRIAAGIYTYRIAVQSPQGSFTQTKQMTIQ